MSEECTHNCDTCTIDCDSRESGIPKAELNPAATVSAQSVLSDIQKELDDDDLGQQFYKRLTS